MDSSRTMAETIGIETERLRLRLWSISDLEPFAALNADPRVMEFFPRPLSREESDAMADLCARFLEADGWGVWALERRDTAEFIGFAGLNIPATPHPFQPCVEVGWRLAFAQWGRGFATEAARAALSVGFERLELTEIVSFAAPSNLRSLRVMEHLGLRESGLFLHADRPEGTPFREQVLYRLRREDWKG